MCGALFLFGARLYYTTAVTVIILSVTVKCKENTIQINITYYSDIKRAEKI